MEYWKPSVTADIVAVDIHQAKFRDDGVFVNLILIKRDEKSDAYPGCWALPGGFLEKGEGLPECAVRELKEETGLDAKMLAPIGVFSDPNRDPRGQVISNAYITVLMSTDESPLPICAGDDAKEIERFRLKGDFSSADGSLAVNLYSPKTKEKIEFVAKFSRGDFGLISTAIEYKSDTKLAFDHAEILARAILRSPDLVVSSSEKKIGEEEESKEETAENMGK